MIWVSGESLIDLLPSGPVPGGGAANTAIALARLGHEVHFVGGLSSDDLGDLLRNNLADNGVDLSKSLISDLPTAKAIISLNENGSASYEFVLENTATFTFDAEKLPEGSPKVLHIGSLATVVEPSASQLFDWATNLDAAIVFDPNVRPAVLSDVERYRESVLRWAGISTVIKLSDEDLSFLFPDHSPVDALAELMHEGCELIVLTKGPEGVVGITRDHTVAVPGVKVEVIDTVGAGDTVGAIVVAALATGSSLQAEELERVLERAVRAAAITCSRAGCNPPTAAELK